MNTVEAVFPWVSVYLDSTSTLDVRTTFVVVASRGRGLPESFTDADGNLIAYQLSQEMLLDLKKRNGETILTDNYAPVENMIAPVYLRALE